MSEESMTSVVPVPPPLAPILASPTILTTGNSVKHDAIEDSFQCLGNYFKQCITRINPIPQSGPNCGLAALAMVSALTPNCCSINDIFNEAKSRGFTCNGEMFSVSNMKILAETILAPWFLIEEFADGLDVNRTLITKELYDGALMLVPYDADKNHSPCCMSGHKAHWAVVCGVMESVAGEVYVAARHGKSRHLGVWSLESLGHSNANLTELDPARQRDEREYVLPPGGVRVGLSNKFILLTKKQ